MDFVIYMMYFLVAVFGKLTEVLSLQALEKYPAEERRNKSFCVSVFLLPDTGIEQLQIFLCRCKHQLDTV